ncbi:hypothetical protein, partial [Klebsiella quasipneumoniae]|uniref:hypothetical protein n=1 Tax=Klebsiella quasipneumoniae TaxID=1463165 RepID=UPI001A9153E9
SLSVRSERFPVKSEISASSLQNVKMHLIVTNALSLRQKNCSQMRVDFADCGGGWRVSLHRLTL